MKENIFLSLIKSSFINQFNFICRSSLTTQATLRGLGFGVWGLGFGVWCLVLLVSLLVVVLCVSPVSELLSSVGAWSD